MAARKPRAVVVGTGFGVLTHARGLRAAGFEVVGLVGRNPAKTAERARGAGIPHALTSLTEALALPGVDVVTVATPPHTHADLVLEALAAGRHVVCEKPFARDADEGRRLLEAAKAAGVVHLLGTEFRFATGQALATRAIHAGAIGEPRLASFLLHVPMIADPASEVPDWWSDADQGGGWLGAYASHLIDQIRVTLGEFEGVSASLTHVAERAGHHGGAWSAEDAYTIHFRTRTGVDGVLQSTPAAWGPPLVATRIAGSRGTLWIQGDEVWVADASGSRRLDVPADLENPPPDPPPADLIATAYDRFHAAGIDLPPFARLFSVLRDCIDGAPLPDDPAPGTFADGVAGMEVLDAIRRSSAEHVWVPVGGAV